MHGSTLLLLGNRNFRLSASYCLYKTKVPVLIGQMKQHGCFCLSGSMLERWFPVINFTSLETHKHRKWGKGFFSSFISHERNGNVMDDWILLETNINANIVVWYGATKKLNYETLQANVLRPGSNSPAIGISAVRGLAPHTSVAHWSCASSTFTTIFMYSSHCFQQFRLQCWTAFL